MRATRGIDQSKIHDVAKLPGGRASGLGIIATGLMYNTKVFKENGWAPPTSWNDLKDPKYKGKVVMPPLNNGYGLLTVVMLARLHGGGENNINPGFDVMKKDVGPNILAYEPSRPSMPSCSRRGRRSSGSGARPACSRSSMQACRSTLSIRTRALLPS